jgi:hypothetical protein
MQVDFVSSQCQEPQTKPVGRPRIASNGSNNDTGEQLEKCLLSLEVIRPKPKNLFLIRVA